MLSIWKKKTAFFFFLVHFRIYIYKPNLSQLFDGIYTQLHTHTHTHIEKERKEWKKKELKLGWKRCKLFSIIFFLGVQTLCYQTESLFYFLFFLFSSLPYNLPKPFCTPKAVDTSQPLTFFFFFFFFCPGKPPRLFVYIYVYIHK